MWLPIHFRTEIVFFFFFFLFRFRNGDEMSKLRERVKCNMMLGVGKGAYRSMDYVQMHWQGTGKRRRDQRCRCVVFGFSATNKSL